MGWQLSVQLGFLSLALLLCSLSTAAAAKGADNSSSVRFLDTPFNYTSNKTAAFSFASPNASYCGCANTSVLICTLDDFVFSDCSNRKETYFNLDNGPHSFEVCINGTTQQIDCALYHWTVDSISPSASLIASKPSISGMDVTIDINFTEPCSTGGSFQCSSADSCNLLVKGPGEVIPSSLEVVEAYLKYKVLVRLDPTVESGDVYVSMDEGFCADAAGNKFRRTGKSSVSISYDRTNQTSSFSSQIPEKIFKLNGEERTSTLATNNLDTIKFAIHFLQPVVNSSAQILSALNISEGRIVVPPVDGGKIDNQTFTFMVTNISERRAIIDVSLKPNSKILSPLGTPVSPITPFKFVYDTERPVVWLSTPKARTREDDISITIHFEKPVLDFNSSNITISGGLLQSFGRINLVMYGIKVRAVGERIHVKIPENITEDLAGNKNLPSSFLKVWHDPHSAPALSVATSSFATASFVGLSMASGLLTVSTAALQVTAASPSSTLTSLPSTNLFRMLSFIQVISMSGWVMDTPNEYYEVAQRLQWSIPRYTFPWDHHRNPKLPSNTSGGGLSKKTLTSTLFKGFPTKPNKPASSDETASGNPPSLPVSITDIILTCKDPHKNSKMSVIYPDPDDKEKNDKKNGMCSSGDRKDPENIWKKICKDNLALAITTGSVLAVHFLLLSLVKSKRKAGISTQKPINYGGLTFPRIEIFLALEAITSLCDAFSSLIHVGEPLEVAVGVIGLMFVILAVLAIFVFLLVGVTFGKLLHYEEEISKEGGRLQKLWGLILGPGGKGRWTWKGRPDSVYLTMFGLLFEDLRGPLHPNNLNLKVNAIWKKLPRSLSSYYYFIDSLKRVCLGILAGAELENWFCKSPAITMLCINCLLLMFILLVKPFSERRVQLVNIIAVASEVGIYALGVPLQDEEFFKENKPVFERLMVGLVIVGILPLIANEVYGMYNEVKKLDDPDGNGSFSKGLKIAVDGLCSFFTSSSSSSAPQSNKGGQSIENPLTSPKPSPLVVAPTDMSKTREDGKSTSKEDAEGPSDQAAPTQIQQVAKQVVENPHTSPKTSPSPTEDTSKDAADQEPQTEHHLVVAPLAAQKDTAKQIGSPPSSKIPTAEPQSAEDMISTHEAASTQTKDDGTSKSKEYAEEAQTEEAPTQIQEDAKQVVGSAPSSKKLEGSI